MRARQLRAPQRFQNLFQKPLVAQIRAVAYRVGGTERKEAEEAFSLVDQRMCTPEIARAITSRWISEVPSKMV